MAKNVPRVGDSELSAVVVECRVIKLSTICLGHCSVVCDWLAVGYVINLPCAVATVHSKEKEEGGLCFL